MSSSAPVASPARPVALPSYAGLRRRERATDREVKQVAGILNRLDPAADSEAFDTLSRMFTAASAAHFAAVAALNARYDDPPPPAGPAAGRLSPLSEYELLQREARDQHAPSDRGRLLALPYAAYEESIEGANTLARQHEGDLLDLVSEWEPPY